MVRWQEHGHVATLMVARTWTYRHGDGDRNIDTLTL